MAFFRKKPVVIEAFRLNVDAPPMWWKDVVDEGDAFSEDGGETFVIHTLEGDMRARRGDYVICGVQDEIYPCKPDIFEATYDAVQAEPDLPAA